MSRAREPGLAFEGTLESFFWQQLGAAQDSEGTELPESVEAYLVHLLASHVRRTEVAGRTSPPLATQLLAARQRGASALREVGDRALYIAGVVPRCLDRTPVDVRYVSGIGEAAYREVHARSSRLQVFEELADAFGDIVDLLGRVVEPEAGEGNLLEIYERWLRGGDARDARRLIAAGIRLDRGDGNVIQ
jgi:hypothetical protein